MNTTIRGIFAILAIAVALFFTVSGCETEQFEDPLVVACPLLKDSIEGVFWFSTPHHCGCWYAFTTDQQCPMKFMYYCDSLSVNDTLYLDENYPNATNLVGNAYYIITGKDSIDFETSHYTLTQGREWWVCKYNNNSVCNHDPWLMQFDACTILHEIGDTIRIYKR